MTPEKLTFRIRGKLTFRIGGTPPQKRTHPREREIERDRKIKIVQCAALSSSFGVQCPVPSVHPNHVSRVQCPSATAI